MVTVLLCTTSLLSDCRRPRAAAGGCWYFDSRWIVIKFPTTFGPSATGQRASYDASFLPAHIIRAFHLHSSTSDPHPLSVPKISHHDPVPCTYLSLLAYSAPPIPRPQPPPLQGRPCGTPLLLRAPTYLTLALSSGRSDALNPFLSLARHPPYNDSKTVLHPHTTTAHAWWKGPGDCSAIKHLADHGVYAPIHSLSIHRATV